MSVINTMLQDLEQRGGKRDLSKEEILQGLSSATTAMTRRDGLNPYLVSLFSVLTVCALLVLAYLYSPYRLVAARQDVPRPQPQAVVAQPEPQHEPQSGPAVAVATAAGNAAGDEAVAARAVEVAAVEKRITQARQAETNAPAPPAKQPVETLASVVPAKTAAPAVTPNNIKPAKTDNANSAAATQHSAETNAALQRDEDEAVISKTRREPGNGEKSENAYARAMALFSQGRTDESRLQLKQALGLDPANGKASQLLAAIYLGEDRPELAADILDSGLKLRPADQDLLRMYLQVQVRMKNYAQAIGIMERRIRVNSPEDIAYLAGLYQKNNDHLGAVRLYAQALKLMPSNSVWWMGQGISLEALGMNEEAIKSYRQSIESGRLNTQLAEYVLGRIASIEKLAKDPVS